MKKLLIFSIISALICATVFAEVTVTTGAGMSFIPIGAVIKPADDDDSTKEGVELVTGFGRNGGASAELQLNVEGKTENGKAGFLFQWRPKLLGDGTLSAGELSDNAGVWFKPLDVIRIDAGKFANNDIRGQVGSGNWFGDYTIGRPGEGEIFSNFSGTFATMVKLTPIEGLSIYAMLNKIVTPNSTLKTSGETYRYVPVLKADGTPETDSDGRPKYIRETIPGSTYYEKTNDGSYTNWGPAWGATKGTEWIWQNLQAAVGYAIPNIGLARVQFVGTYIPETHDELGPEDFTDAPRIEAAFAFTGVPNLTLDVGGKVYVPVTDPKADPGLWPTEAAEKAASTEDYSYWKGINVGLGVKYAADPLTVNFIIDAQKLGGTWTYGKTSEVKDGLELRPWVAVNYKLNDTFSAQLEGGLKFVGEGKITYEDTTRPSQTMESTVSYGFGAGLQTTLAPSCTIKTGLTYAAGKVRGAWEDGTQKAEDTNGVFSVPIIFSVSF
jgi:hypothetical protein